MTGVCRGCQNGWSGSFCNISSSNSTTPPNCPWLSNLVATASPADLNDDFHVNIFDIVSVIENWGCVGDSCSGDVNHDGIVDLRDIVMLISAWTG